MNPGIGHQVKMEIKRFCLHPFKRAQIAVSGDVFVCCSSWTGMSLGNIFKSDFKDIWNSENAVKIRRSIIGGTFQYCDHSLCPRIISGMVAEEALTNEAEKISQSNLSKLKQGPVDLSLNYDFSCNLYCESCRKEIKTMSIRDSDRLIKFQLTLMNTLMFKNIKRLTVTGAGEPFASRVFMDLFTKMDQRKLPDIKITLRTNGMALSPGNWRRIKNAHFAIDRILISIDAATPDTYHVLRRGGNFEQLKKNLKFISSIKKKSKLYVGLNFVVQKTNFKEMPEFVHMAKKFDLDGVTFTQLMDRNTFQSGEFRDRAIHHPEHPRFNELKEIMKSPILRDPIVSFANLSHLL